MSMRHIVAGAPALYTHRLCACSRIDCAPLRGCCFVDTLLQKCHSGLRPLFALCARASRSLLCPLRGPGAGDWYAVALWIQCCINVTPAARAGCSPRRFAARGRRAVARLLVGPKGSSMPIVRDPPSPLKYIGVPTDYPLDLDLDIQP
jgi:hypothetical protein